MAALSQAFTGHPREGPVARGLPVPRRPAVRRRRRQRPSGQVRGPVPGHPARLPARPPGRRRRRGAGAYHQGGRPTADGRQAGGASPRAARRTRRGASIRPRRCRVAGPAPVRSRRQGTSDAYRRYVPRLRAASPASDARRPATGGRPGRPRPVRATCTSSWPARTAFSSSTSTTPTSASSTTSTGTSTADEAVAAQERLLIPPVLELSPSAAAWRSRTNAALLRGPGLPGRAHGRPLLRPQGIPRRLQARGGRGRLPRPARGGRPEAGRGPPGPHAGDHGLQVRRQGRRAPDPGEDGLPRRGAVQDLPAGPLPPRPAHRRPGREVDDRQGPSAAKLGEGRPGSSRFRLTPAPA
ncbi:MAG: hypothetical protein MZW92_10445 [Comamonadaceae bacterium]|nr:hypothetical protein [Comamonadaceae bacterium]